jgi:antitoxin component YwqK of YwqJK toxin-antitoxin module
MKYLLFLLFSIFVLSCKNETQVTDVKLNQLVKKNSKFYFNDKLFSGVAKDSYSSGITHNEFYYSNGIITLHREYNDKGQLISSISLNESEEKHGSVISYHNNGILAFEGNYQNGKEHGTIKYYRESGKLVKEENYKNGILHGDSKSYYENEGKAWEKKYNEGKLDGIQRLWEENQNGSNGELYYFKGIEENYKDGILISKVEKCYDENYVETSCEAKKVIKPIQFNYFNDDFFPYGIFDKEYGKIIAQCLVYFENDVVTAVVKIPGESNWKKNDIAYKGKMLKVGEFWYINQSNSPSINDPEFQLSNPRIDKKRGLIIQN